MSESVAKITKKWCLVKNNRRKIHFSNTISLNFDTFPTLYRLILTLFQLFGDGFVGETGGSSAPGNGCFTLPASALRVSPCPRS